VNDTGASSFWRTGAGSNDRERKRTFSGRKRRSLKTFAGWGPVHVDGVRQRKVGKGKSAGRWGDARRLLNIAGIGKGSPKKKIGGLGGSSGERGKRKDIPKRTIQEGEGGAK